MKQHFLFCVLVFSVLVHYTLPASAAEPNSIKIEKKNSLYFGWEEDHPKAISIMGGALFARRPQLTKNDDHSWDTSKKAWHKDSDKPLFFMLSVDGSEPYYPDETTPTRRKDIQWGLAESNLPFPQSTWIHKNIRFEVTHLGRRLLDNTLNAVYTRVTLTNLDERPHNVKVVVAGESASERCFPLKKSKVTTEGKTISTEVKKLTKGKSLSFEFVSPANGEADLKRILSQGNFQKNYNLEKKRIEDKFSKLTMPTSLPDERFLNLWRASMFNMWNATVKTDVDYEQRGSGGTLHEFYQYDRTFDHDVPDMVIQYIIEGNWDVARQIMKGATYDRLSQGELKREAYLDAIPKYIVTHAQYLQLTGDKPFFTPDLMNKLKTCSRAVQNMREFTDDTRQKGVYGLVRKGHTLDNNRRTYTLVDDFAALHGFTAYKYICETLGQKEEAEWAYNQMKDLNDCLNKAIRKSVDESGLEWYNACFSFDMDDYLVSGPGNWLGTTFMMPTFPWNAQLKGFDLGGEWLDYLDNSIEKWLEVARSCGAPKGSVGAWWNAKYGAAYNTGMVMPLLTSDKYRTLIPESIDWLLENQTAPLIWAESFHKPDNMGDWTRPEVDYETWGLGFIRQAMLQMCVSVKTNSDVIIGRGIPDHWIEGGKKIAWDRVHINDGKQIKLSIQKKDQTIEVKLGGDTNTGNYIIDLPYCVGKVKDVSVVGGKLVSKDASKGKVVVSGSSTKVTIQI